MREVRRAAMGAWSRLATPVIGALLSLGATNVTAMECLASDAQQLNVLRSLRAASFQVADNAERQRLALALSACLGDPRSEVRDDIAYSALSTWLRSEALDAGVRLELLRSLSEQLWAANANALKRSFSALALSEVVRTDRVSAWMDDAQRTGLVDVAASFISSIRDRRGFDPEVGWRHAVAHGADLAAQLAFNPKISAAQCRQLLTALALQIAPAGADAYIDAEPQRLARAVSLIAARLHDGEDAWRARFRAWAPAQGWMYEMRTPVGLARIHNVKAFLQALYVETHRRNEAIVAEPLLHAVGAELDALP
jgi:hypothetical protein